MTAGTGIAPVAELRLRLGHGLAAIQATLHNGPGWRVGLWVQGCRLRCTDRCLNPHLLEPNGGQLVSPAEVADAVLRVASESGYPVEGITVLGGEPSEQAAALVCLFARLRAAGLSTMVYSGYTLAALRRQADPAIAALLAATDVLVDGPYLPHLGADLPWRGSANQCIHRLTARYTEAELEQSFAHQRKSFSLTVRPDGSWTMSGLQEREAAAAIEAHLVGTGEAAGHD